MRFLISLLGLVVVGVMSFSIYQYITNQGIEGIALTSGIVISSLVMVYIFGCIVYTTISIFQK